MQTVTRLDAEKAIREGTETARLRRQLEVKQKLIDELTSELTRTQARLKMNRGILARHNRVLALKYSGAREAREYERREARGDKIDCFILGMGFGVILAIGVASWIAFMM